MVWRILRFGAAIAVLHLCGELDVAYAQQQPLREMHHTAWTAADGAPQVITAIAQDRHDGTLWIGSESGLFNFDGLTFTRFQGAVGQPQVPIGSVSSLLVTKTGTLWIAFFESGVIRIVGDRVTVFNTVADEPLTTTAQLREAPDGSVWAIGNRRLIRFDRRGMWRYEPTAAESRVSGVFVDSFNILWLVQGQVLYRRPLTQSGYFRTDVRADVVTDFVQTPRGDIWINDYDVASSRGRTQQINRRGERVGMLPQSEFTTGRLVAANDGSLILASFSAGIRRFRTEEASLATPRQLGTVEPDVFTRHHGLSSNSPDALMLDSHGNIWIGGLRGLDRLRPARLTRFMPDAEAGGWAVCASPRGEIWVANTSGELFAISGETSRPLRSTGNPLYSLACADGGRAWFANNHGIWAIVSGRIVALPPIIGARPRTPIKVLAASDTTLYAVVAAAVENGGIWRYQSGHWTKLIREVDLGKGGYAAYLDRADRLWIGDANGRAIVHTSTAAQSVGSSEPGLGDVHAFLDTSRGLFAGGANGLAVLRGPRFEMLAFAEPSLARGVRGLAEAPNGDLWLNAANGFALVPSAEIDAALARPAHAIASTAIREGDFAGAGAPQGLVTYLNTAAVDSIGQLWFTTRNGVVRLTPERSAVATKPPLLTIRSMVADGQMLGDNGTLAPATRSLQIRYFGVNLSAPESVIYRYRLEGIDESWEDAGRRTEVVYTRLPPGTYRFSVMASNGDGTWTDPVSSAPFTVLPRFYQTQTFAVAMVILACLLTALIHRVRVRQISRVMAVRFDERLAERTRVAREVHDTLLQTIHGSKLVADRALLDVADPAKQHHALEQLSAWLEQASTEGRAALQSLRASTAEANNLADALQHAIDECRQGTGAIAALEVLGDTRDVHPAIRHDVYQLGREAIRNACAHAHAERIDVTLEYGNAVTLRVSDNGVGMPPATIAAGRDGHFGLRGMRERAERIGADFTIVSTPGAGTVVTLVLPGRIAFRKT